MQIHDWTLRPNSSGDGAGPSSEDFRRPSRWPRPGGRESKFKTTLVVDRVDGLTETFISGRLSELRSGPRIPIRALSDRLVGRAARRCGMAHRRDVRLGAPGDPLITSTIFLSDGFTITSLFCTVAASGRSTMFTVPSASSGNSLSSEPRVRRVALRKKLDVLRL